MSHFLSNANALNAIIVEYINKMISEQRLGNKIDAVDDHKEHIYIYSIEPWRHDRVSTRYSLYACYYHSSDDLRVY